MRGRAISTLVGIGAGILVVSAAVADEPLPDTIEFNRHIRPILSDHCYTCHGPDSAARQADLRLDRRDDAVAMKAIVPGNVKTSAMLARILSSDPNEVMPPPRTKKTLTREQKQLLTQWIRDGAEYEPHWSYLAPKDPPLPKVQTPNWVTNAIDTFVLSRLESEGLSPAPRADRRTIARRLSLDLTGLPPMQADLVQIASADVPVQVCVTRYVRRAEILDAGVFEPGRNVGHRDQFVGRIEVHVRIARRQLRYQLIHVSYITETVPVRVARLGEERNLYRCVEADCTNIRQWLIVIIAPGNPDCQEHFTALTCSMQNGRRHNLG